MADPELMELIRLTRDFVSPSNRNVAEIDSYQMNEEGRLRAIFSGCSYTGLELLEWPGVDIVAWRQEVNLPSDSFNLLYDPYAKGF